MKQFIEFIPIALFVAVYFTTKDIFQDGEQMIAQVRAALVDFSRSP